VQAFKIHKRHDYIAKIPPCASSTIAKEEEEDCIAGEEEEEDHLAGAVANMASYAISSSLILVIRDSMINGTNHIV
jgi:hypothetical protein